MFSTKITFVTGKGGTGKSTIASALAWKSAQRGYKTLLVDLAGESRLQNLKLPAGLTVQTLTGTSSLKTFVKHYIRVPGLAELFFENRVMRSFLNVAPAVNELAILGQITSGVRKVGPAMNFDRIIVDTFATGHALALFKAPGGMAQAVSSGPMGRDSRKIQEVLSNPAIVDFVLVTLPEEMPVDESIELRQGLSELFPQEPRLVVNRVELGRWSLEELRELQGKSGTEAEKQWAKYLLRQKSVMVPVFEKIHQEFPKNVQVPLIYSSDVKVVTEQVGEILWIL